MYNKETNVLTVGDYQVDLKAHAAHVREMLVRPSHFWSEGIKSVKLPEALIVFGVTSVVIAIAQVLITKSAALFASSLIGSAMQIVVSTGIFYGITLIFKSKDLSLAEVAKACAMVGVVAMPLTLVSLVPMYHFYQYAAYTAFAVSLVSLYIAYQMLKHFLELSRGQLQLVLVIPVLLQINTALPLVMDALRRSGVL